MNRHMSAITKLFPVLALLAAGCGQTPASIHATPPPGPLSSAGETLVLAARVLDAKGEEIQKPNVVWTSSAPEVAEVDAAGTVTAKKSGEAVIAVQAGQIKEEIPVKVAIYSAIKANETAITLAINEKKQVMAQLFDENNNPVEGFVEWKIDNEAIAKVNAEGMVEGVAVGAATLTGSTKTQSTTIAVTVAAPAPASLKAVAETVEIVKGETGKVEVQGFDANNAPVAVTVNWSSSDPAKATVAPDGTVTAVEVGEAVLTATDASGMSATVKVIVK